VEETMSKPPTPSPVADASTPAPTAKQPATNLTVSRGFADWLRANKLSMAFTSYQTGQLFLVGVMPNGTVSFNQQNFTRAMGLSYKPGRLYLGALHQVWRLENMLRPGQMGNQHFEGMSTCMRSARILLAE
jgi:hypothetical protein